MLEPQENQRAHATDPPTPSTLLSAEPASSVDPEKQPSEAPPESKVSAFKSLGLLDRFLALWIFLAMVIGILLGNFVPNTGPALQKGKFVSVSVPIAVGLLVMMYPILLKIKYESLHLAFATRKIWIQIAFSVVVNWIIAPFLMVTLRNPLSVLPFN